jgi:hypothetical protein
LKGKITDLANNSKEKNIRHIYRRINESKKNYLLTSSLAASVKKEALNNILITSGVPLKQVSLIKMCLIETNSGDRMGKILARNFPVQNSLKQCDDVLSPLLFNFALKYAIRKVKEKACGMGIE